MWDTHKNAPSTVKRFVVRLIFPFYFCPLMKKWNAALNTFSLTSFYLENKKIVHVYKFHLLRCSSSVELDKKMKREGRKGKTLLRERSCRISIKRPIIFKRRNVVKAGWKTETRQIKRIRGKKRTIVEEVSRGIAVGQSYSATDPDRLDVSKWSGYDNWHIAAGRYSTRLPDWMRSDLITASY